MPKAQPKAPPLKTLLTKGKSQKYLFNNICTFVDGITEATTENQLSVRLEKLDELWESINETINTIEIHDEYPEGDEACNKERIDYSNRYYDTKAKILDRLKQFEQTWQNTSDRTQSSTTHAVTEHVRLPQIMLQTFDGNIDKWLSFRDLYTSLIHLKADLPDVEKFHYLKGCLVGEAKSLVDPLAITNTNYQVAWKTLTKCYNDSKLLKRRQVQALFKLPSLVKESATELQSLLEGSQRVIQTLDQVVQPADYKDLLLMEIISSRLDPITRRCWEEHSATKEQDKVMDLIDFLQTRVKILGSLPTKPSEPRREAPKPPVGKPPFIRSSHSATQYPGLHCVACSESHPLYQCPTFQQMSVWSRDKLLRSHSLCRNCFRRGHQASDCPSRYVCRSCKGKHHTLVCFNTESIAVDDSSPSDCQASDSQPTNKPNSNMADPATNGSVSSNVAANRSAPVLLATAVVLVEDDEGATYPARALLDSGSECNFMAERLCQKLQVQRRSTNIDVVGIGRVNMSVKYRIEAKVKSRVSGFSQGMEFLILPNVTSNLPTASVRRSNWNIPQGVELADPSFFESTAVDLVIGIQHFFDLFKSGRIALGNGLPTLNESVFGWIVSGVVGDSDAAAHTSCYMAVATSSEKPSNHDRKEERCRERLKRTMRRSKNVQYTVPHPRNNQLFERRLDMGPERRNSSNPFMLEREQAKVDTGTGRPIQRQLHPSNPRVQQGSYATRVVVFNGLIQTKHRNGSRQSKAK